MFSASTYSCTSFVPSYFICTFSKLLPQVFLLGWLPRGVWKSWWFFSWIFFFLALFLAVELLPGVQSPFFQEGSRSWFGILYLKGFQRLLRCIFCVKSQLSCLPSAGSGFRCYFPPKHSLLEPACNKVERISQGYKSVGATSELTTCKGIILNWIIMNIIMAPTNSTVEIITLVSQKCGCIWENELIRNRN